MKKKTMALCLALVLIVVAAVGGTLAYFTDEDSKTNTFTMGNVNIELTEANWNAPDNALPGVAYAKEPVVKNIGKNSAWIRVDVTLSDARAFKTAAAEYNINDLSGIFTGHNESKWTRAAITEGADTLTYSYYYNSLLAPGANTEALFTAVEIPAQFDNEDMAAIGDNFTITIKAHAIQASDDFDTVQKAFAKYN